MSKLAIILFALSLVLLPIHGGPFMITTEIQDCPPQNTCLDAQEFCSNQTDTSGYMNFTCHSGSMLGVFDCATGPETNCTGNVTLNVCELLPIPLGTTENFGAIAGSTITNTGGTTINAMIGVYPGTAITGAPAATESHSANLVSGAGIADLLIAYNAADALVLCPISTIGDLGGMTLPPGLYKSTSFMEINTDLYLDAEHDGEAVWVFQMVSHFLSATSTQVILLNGAKASNIFWQVGSSATLGADSVMEGTMMADQSIVLGIGAVVNGRVLARIAAVNLNANVITIPAGQ